MQAARCVGGAGPSLAPAPLHPQRRVGARVGARQSQQGRRVSTRAHRAVHAQAVADGPDDGDAVFEGAERAGDNWRAQRRLMESAGRADAGEDDGADEDGGASRGGLAGMRSRLDQARIERGRLKATNRMGIAAGVSPPEARVPWRTRAAAVKPQEDSPALAGWQVLLSLAAREGVGKEAATMLRTMELGDDKPGPREYHSVVVAHLIGGDIEGALDTMNDAHRNGERLLYETYTALMRTAVAQGDFQLAAEAHFASSRAEYSPFDSWLLLAKALFKRGLDREAFAWVAQGEQEGFEADSELALAMLWVLARRREQQECNRLMERLRERNDMDLTGDHQTALVYSMIYAVGKRDTLQMELLGRFFPTLDTNGTNLLLAEMRAHLTQLQDTGVPWNPSALLNDMERSLRSRGHEPTVLTYVLACEVSVQMWRPDLALRFLRQLRRFPEAEGGSGAAMLSPDLVGYLARILARQGSGRGLLELLRALNEDGLQLTGQGVQSDVFARSPAGRWLHNLRAPTLDMGMVSLRLDRAERAEASAAKRTEKLQRSSAAVSLPPLSKMRLSDLREEANALGLDPVGNRKEIYERVRDARYKLKEGSADAMLVAAAMKWFGNGMGEGEDGEVGDEDDDEEEEDWAEPAAEGAADGAADAAADTLDEEVDYTGGSGAAVEDELDDDEEEEDEGTAAMRGAAGRRVPQPLSEVEQAESALSLLKAVQDMTHADALAVALEVLACADAAGAPPTEADLILVAKEARAAGDKAAARRLLDAAGAGGATPNLALFLLAAEAAAAAGDRAAALQVLDEADWAGHEVPEAYVPAVLAAARGITESTADLVRVRPRLAARRVRFPREQGRLGGGGGGAGVKEATMAR